MTKKSKTNPHGLQVGDYVYIYIKDEPDLAEQVKKTFHGRVARVHEIKPRLGKRITYRYMLSMDCLPSEYSKTSGGVYPEWIFPCTDTQLVLPCCVERSSSEKH